MVVGDVSGKGILAAADTAKVKYLLRDKAHTLIEPNEVLASVKAPTLDDLIKGLVNEVSKFSSNHADDMLILALKKT